MVYFADVCRLSKNAHLKPMLALPRSLCGSSATAIETPPKKCNYAKRGAVIDFPNCGFSIFPTVLSNECILSFSPKFIPYPFKV